MASTQTFRCACGHNNNVLLAIDVSKMRRSDTGEKVFVAGCDISVFAIFDGHFRDLVSENTRHKMREAQILRDMKSAQALMYEYADLFHDVESKLKHAEEEAIKLRQDCDCWWNPAQVRRRNGH
ncbi:hypothetical protein C8Q76DRAFT_803101 [Earliella scabrosa]|nr:hypothetical protein C8Q76DRAFT_803101 [Earliella scabrosa]